MRKRGAANGRETTPASSAIITPSLAIVDNKQGIFWSGGALLSAMLAWIILGRRPLER